MKTQVQKDNDKIQLDSCLRIITTDFEKSAVFTQTPQILKNLWCLAQIPQILVKFHQFLVDDSGGRLC